MCVPPFINRFLTIFLLVALPVQSCPAVAVLLCQDNLGAHATDHRLSHHESHAANQQSEPPSDLACDDCVFCHLTINYSTPIETSLFHADLSTTAYLFSPYHFYLFIPEQPQRPPKHPHV